MGNFLITANLFGQVPKFEQQFIAGNTSKYERTLFQRRKKTASFAFR